MSGGEDAGHWARVADQWIAWARTPGHDAFWAYREAFGGFVGRGDGAALEVGCGEGRVSRLLGELGWRVTATDVTPALLDAARQAGSAEAFVLASAEALPFADGAFDLVVAYNMLMDVEDLAGAVRETARVLRPGGVMAISVVHPIADRVHEGGLAPGTPYFDEARFADRAERGGLVMDFAGWARPLQAYAAALEAAGLAIVSLREPEPAADAAGLDRWRELPLFLWLKARAL